ncbi:hypothetical protein [Simkania sp.]
MASKQPLNGFLEQIHLKAKRSRFKELEVLAFVSWSISSGQARI